MKSNKLAILFSEKLSTSKQHEFLKLLLQKFGTQPQSENLPDNFHGYFIDIHVTNKYFNSSIELLLNTDELETWYYEVTNVGRDILRGQFNGFIYVFDTIDDDEITVLLDINKSLAKVTVEKDEIDWIDQDKLFLAVTMDEKSSRDWEELSEDNDILFLEYKNLEDNKFREKMGINRIIESIENHYWDYHEVNDTKKSNMKDLNVGKEETFNPDISELLSDLSLMKKKISQLDDDKKHDAAMGFINDLINNGSI